MRLPRRTPAAGEDELAQLYSFLYPDGACAIAIDQAYRAKRTDGVRRCQIWMNRGACPHAVESTMTLIEAQQLDEDTSHLHAWSVRTSYAMAILRFVNALADEKQTGMYAQSIFGIAERIKLPVWFVELRHAATHEELPSLDVLRRASVEALRWLLTRFWLPNLKVCAGADDGGVSPGAVMAGKSEEKIQIKTEEAGGSQDVDIDEIERAITAMEQRILDTPSQRAIPQASRKKEAQVHAVEVAQLGHNSGQYQVLHLFSGWSLAGHEWQSTPIGCLRGGVPRLELLE